VVTLGFRLMGKLDVRTTAGFILAQLAGAVAGCLPLLFWGPLGRSIDFGATTRGDQFGVWTAFAGEAITTFALVVALCTFIAYRPIRNYTPFMIPFLYAIMVPLEADISGTSTNPARSFGPAVISGQWQEAWIYWIGPFTGMVFAIMVCSFFARRIEVAKLYHFESDDRRFFGKNRYNSK
jgi:aquaporin Z